MDTARNITVPRDETTGAIDWPEIIEGRDGLLTMAADLSHQLHFLMHGLEFPFSPGRAKSTSQDGVVTYMFQDRSIAATLWLTAEAWTRTRDLMEHIDAIRDALEADADKEVAK